MSETNHWAEKIAQNAIDKFGNEQVVCSGWSPSGIYHIGNSREAITCNAIHKFLKERGANSKFILIIDDMDPLDKIPKNLGKYTKQLRPYLGHPIMNVPDFTGESESYAMHFAKGAIRAFENFRFDAEFVYASELYKQGLYDDLVRLYFEKEEEVQKVLEEISGSRLSTFLSVICEKCGNIKTTTVTKFENDKIHYQCRSDKQYRGCDHDGVMNLESHNWKLKWRLDWPARQKFLGVTVEPSGKDHSVAGGSVDTALAIHEKIFGDKTPLLERYGFITIKGKKLSGSKGGALPAEKIDSIMPPSIYLFLIYRSDLTKDVSFNPNSMEFADLIDEFDIARRILKGLPTQRSKKEAKKLAIAAKLSLFDEDINVIPANIKYSELVLLYQLNMRNIDKTIEHIKKLGNKIYDESSIVDLKRKLIRLDKWLDEFAPDSLKFVILDSPKEDIAKYWTEELKKLWIDVLSHDYVDPTDMNSKIRELTEKYNLTIKEVYKPVYQLLLGSDRGPKLANLLLEMDRDKIIENIKNIEV